MEPRYKTLGLCKSIVSRQVYYFLTLVSSASKVGLNIMIRICRTILYIHKYIYIYAATVRSQTWCTCALSGVFFVVKPQGPAQRSDPTMHVGLLVLAMVLWIAISYLRAGGDVQRLV